MSQTPRFVYGPPQDGSVTLFTYIGDKFYVLRSDPNVSFPPYFGVADDSSNYLSLTYSSENQTLQTSNDFGFQQDPTTKSAELVSGIGTFSYTYTGNYAKNSPFMAGLPFLFSANSEQVTFKYKSPSDETNDNSDSNNPNYTPTYAGTVENVILVPINGIPQNNCSSTANNGPFVSYSNSSNPSVYFTTQDYCTDNIINSLCGQGDTCGATTSGSTCIGPCSNAASACEPIGNERVSCENPQVLNILHIALIVGGLLLFLIFLIIVYVFATR